jgi:hypothetical protein
MIRPETKLEPLTFTKAEMVALLEPLQRIIAHDDACDSQGEVGIVITDGDLDLCNELERVDGVLRRLRNAALDCDDVMRQWSDQRAARETERRKRIAARRTPEERSASAKKGAEKRKFYAKLRRPRSVSASVSSARMRLRRARTSSRSFLA